MLTKDKVAGATQPAVHPDVIALRLPPLELGSVTAKAVNAVWGGAPAVVVDSPPGAGKTTLAATVAAHLSARAKLRIAVACNTNAQALDLANRLGALNPATPIVLFGKSKSHRPSWLHRGVDFETNPKKLDVGVNIGTSARWEWVKPSVWQADAMIVDEAYQQMWATFGSLSLLAPQFLLVGDPGQIAPVVTGNVDPWVHNPTGPHVPAPEALIAAAGDHVTRFALPHTHRLGPDTTALVQPAFYPAMAFTSARPQRTLYVNDNAQPELAATVVNGAGHECDPAVLDAAAARVRDVLAHGVLDDDLGNRRVKAENVAVICSRVAQTAGVRSRLSDLPDALVTTVNRAQGLERDVVIAIDPLIGQTSLSQFSTDVGRACVSLSRHRTHLTYITRNDVNAVLKADDSNRAGVRAHRYVRQAFGIAA